MICLWNINAENTIDNSYYDDVNFDKLEAEDEDSDSQILMIIVLEQS